MSTPEKMSTGTLAAYASAAIVWFFFTERFDFVCDDAFISFRYAHHLAEGDGLVYNTARALPVEGYSNFLWVVWLSIFERLGYDIAVPACHSSKVCGLLLLLGTMRLAERRLMIGVGGLAATGLFLASLPAFGLWSTGGLATILMNVGAKVMLDVEFIHQADELVQEGLSLYMDGEIEAAEAVA